MNIDGEDPVVRPQGDARTWELRGVDWAKAEARRQLTDAEYQSVLDEIVQLTNALLRHGVHPADMSAAMLGCGVAIALKFSVDVEGTRRDLKSGIDVLVDEHLQGVAALR